VFGPGCFFQKGEENKRFLARMAAHVKRGLEEAADVGAFGFTEESTKVIVCQMHAAHASGLAMRHPRKRR